MTMNKTKLIKIAIILIYLFSPIDILPEAVLGPLGLVDDAAAIALLIRILLKKIKTWIKSTALCFSYSCKIPSISLNYASENFFPHHFTLNATRE